MNFTDVIPLHELPTTASVPYKYMWAEDGVIGGPMALLMASHCLPNIGAIDRLVSPLTAPSG